MPTKRRRIAATRIGINDAALEAWRAGDSDALRQALSIRPWQMLPWPLRLTALGCDRRHPPTGTDPWDASWSRAAALQRELYRLPARHRRN
jgi:hypothetical protein